MMRRRLQLTVMLFSFIAAFLVLRTQPACGADIQMEIFYLPHRPAMAVVSEVEKVAAEFDNIVIREYSFADPDADKLLKKYNLTEHMPVAIFINGQDSFTVNGQKVNLRNFPKGDAFVPMFSGAWDYADLRIILQNMSGGK
jgi:hypothetical protein